MTEIQTKPWYQSTTIWSGVASIFSGLAGLILLAIGEAGPDTVAVSIGAITGGLGAIRGRIIAAQRIGD
jgi:VIT1/CCC1 family predicted Fe2+/Mn2+ transporter